MIFAAPGGRADLADKAVAARAAPVDELTLVLRLFDGVLPHARFAVAEAEHVVAAEEAI